MQKIKIHPKWDSNPQPLDQKSNALPLSHPDERSLTPSIPLSTPTIITTQPLSPNSFIFCERYCNSHYFPYIISIHSLTQITTPKIISIHIIPLHLLSLPHSQIKLHKPPPTTLIKLLQHMVRSLLLLLILHHHLVPLVYRFQSHYRVRK